jgi:hypothetical protein
MPQKLKRRGYASPLERVEKQTDYPFSRRGDHWSPEIYRLFQTHIYEYHLTIRNIANNFTAFSGRPMVAPTFFMDTLQKK